MSSESEFGPLDTLAECDAAMADLRQRIAEQNNKLQAYVRGGKGVRTAAEEAHADALSAELLRLQAARAAIRDRKVQMADVTGDRFKAYFMVVAKQLLDPAMYQRIKDEAERRLGASERRALGVGSALEMPARAPGVRER